MENNDNSNKDIMEESQLNSCENDVIAAESAEKPSENNDVTAEMQKKPAEKTYSPFERGLALVGALAMVAFTIFLIYIIGGGKI